MAYYKANESGTMIYDSESGDILLASDHDIDTKALTLYEDVKKRDIHNAKSYLNSTDWYVARFIDTGKDIPMDIKLKREECRKLADGFSE